MSVRWGQVVVGPPGSGKTTFCHGMQQFLVGVDRQPVVVNLDPANDVTPYPCAIDVRELVTVDDVMAVHGLGPNGALMFCLEFLEANLDWLVERLSGFKSHYFIFDCPGQAELYTHHGSMARVLAHLQKQQFRLAAVHLVDAHHCADAGKFIPAALLSLATMMRLELPHVNVLSKVDMITSETIAPALDLEYYTSAADFAAIVGTLPGRNIWVEEADGGEEPAGVVPPVAAVATGAGTGTAAAAAATAAAAPPLGSASAASGSSAGAGFDAAIAAAADRKEAVKLATSRRAARFYQRFNKLNESLASVIDDYSLVSFLPASIQDKESVAAVVASIDRANGFVRGFIRKDKP